MPGRRASTRLCQGVAIATGPHPLEAKWVPGQSGGSVGYARDSFGTLTPDHAWGVGIATLGVAVAVDLVILEFVGGVQPLGLTDVKVEVHPAGPFPLVWSGASSRYEFTIPGAGAYFTTLVGAMVIVGFDPRPLI